MITILLLILVTSFACGSGGDESYTKPVANIDTNPAENIKLSSYIERPGDIFTYKTTCNIEYSDGEEISETTYDADTYSQVDSIPSKYSYSDDIKGPYIKNTQTEGDLIDGYTYYSALGTELVDDDLDTFTRIDAETVTGSEEPASVSTGDTYTYSSTATLFSSYTGSEVGSQTINGTFEVKEMEDITVPSGSFQALKIYFTFEMTITEDNSTYSCDSSGSFWYDVESGFIVKGSVSMDCTINELDVTAFASYETVLYDYQINSSKEGKSLHKPDTHSINNSSIIRNLNSLHKKAFLKMY